VAMKGSSGNSGSGQVLQFQRDPMKRGKTGQCKISQRGHRGWKKGSGEGTAQKGAALGGSSVENDNQNGIAKGEVPSKAWKG